MGADRLRDRITDQYSYRGERADVWGVFDLILETDAYLNLGYSRWYQSHVLGSCQRRLADKIGTTLWTYLPATAGVRLLDVGCGRGGPAIYLADRFGFDVTGVDLVPYNAVRARENASGHGGEVEFVVGDATQLPFPSASLTACTAIDSLVYLPERESVFSELQDVLEPGGIVVLSDLVVRDGASEQQRRSVTKFAEAWDMPSLGTVPEYDRMLAEAGLDVLAVEDLTPNSVGRFRKWTTLFGWVHSSPAGRLVDRFFESRGLDSARIVEQVRRAHDALPALQHVLFVAEKRGGA